MSTTKENFVKNKQDELAGYPMIFWRTINEISGIGKNKNSRKVTKIVDEQGNTLENMDAANFLSDFYVNVGPTLAKSHDKEWKKDDCNITVDSSLNFTWVSEIEVKRHVK